jgi:hypothetical protein
MTSGLITLALWVAMDRYPAYFVTTDSWPAEVALFLIGSRFLWAMATVAVIFRARREKRSGRKIAYLFCAANLLVLLVSLMSHWLYSSWAMAMSGLMTFCIGFYLLE